MFGAAGVGKTVLVMELIHAMVAGYNAISVFAVVGLMTIVPVLIGVFCGRALDHWLGLGITWMTFTHDLAAWRLLPLLAFVACYPVGLGFFGSLALLFGVLTRRLNIRAGRAQIVLELIATGIDSQIDATLQWDATPFRVLVGTPFLFTVTSNWISVIPGVEPPTAHLETDAALAAIVFVATIGYGVRANGIWRIARPLPSRRG